MKINDYDWAWWFVLTIIALFIGMLLASVGQYYVANIILVISLVSLLPCLYIGMKPPKQ
jgi:uncharacterized membrane protein YhaH (DUF805 family)